MARREDRLKALADELAGAHRVRAEVIAADLTDADSRGELPAQLDALGLTADILVNNAGFTTMGPVHRADRAAELAMVRTDVEAVVDLCTLFVPGMVDTAPRRGPQHGVDRGVPAAAGTGRLRRVQGLRALLRRAPSVPSCAAPASRSPRCARDRSRPASPSRPA